MRALKIEKEKVTENYLLIAVFSFGLFLRFLIALFATWQWDMGGLVAAAKSLIDTGEVRAWIQSTGHLQTHGYYRYIITAQWLSLLQGLGLIDINYLFHPVVRYVDNPVLYVESLGRIVQNIGDFFMIKMSQLPFDLIFALFLYKTARLLKFSSLMALLLWAVSPLLLLSFYIDFQTDVLVVMLITISIYFLLKQIIISKGNFQGISLNLLISIFFLILGGAIKLSPYFLVPFVIILYSKKWKDFLILGIYTILLFFFLNLPNKTEPWLSYFFLTGPESRSIFNFQINSIPVFVVAYSFLALFALKIKSALTTNKLIIFLYLYYLVFFLSYEQGYLFIQAHALIFPLISLAVLVSPIFSLAHFFLFFNFFRRILFDGSWHTSAVLDTTLNTQLLSGALDYESIFRLFIEPSIVSSIILGFFASGFIYLIYISTLYLQDKKKIFKNHERLFSKNFYFVLILFPIIFFIGFYIFDVILKSNLLTFYYRGAESDKIITLKENTSLIQKFDSKKPLSGIELSFIYLFKAPTDINLNLYRDSTLVNKKTFDSILLKKGERFQWYFPLLKEPKLDNYSYSLEISKTGPSKIGLYLNNNESTDSLVFKPIKNSLILRLRLFSKLQVSELFYNLKDQMQRRKSFFNAYFTLLGTSLLTACLSLVIHFNNKFRK